MNGVKEVAKNERENILPFSSVLQQTARAEQLHKDQLMIHQAKHWTHPPPNKTQIKQQRTKNYFV